MGFCASLEQLLPSQTHSLHQWKKKLDWLSQTNTTVKDTARDTPHHTTTKDTARDTPHHTTTKDTARDTAHHTTVKVTAEDTFHTADQPTTQEESSVAELVVTEEDTTRDVTPQSSAIATLYRWIAQYNKQMKIVFVVKFLFCATNKL